MAMFQDEKRHYNPVFGSPLQFISIYLNYIKSRMVHKDYKGPPVIGYKKKMEKAVTL